MKKKFIVRLAALGVLMATTALSVPAQAEMDMSKLAGWQFRARALGVFPEDNSGTSIGGNVEPSNNVVPEVDITYFWNDRWSTELVLATTRHAAKAYGTALGNLDLGSVSLLPPTLTMQYHFMPDSKFQPYVGAGVNYTMFFNEKIGASGLPIKYDDSFGPAAQVGVDYFVNDHWFLNLDVKKVWISTDVSIAGGAVTADVDIDPWLVGAGFGYRF